MLTIPNEAMGKGLSLSQQRMRCSISNESEARGKSMGNEAVFFKIQNCKLANQESLEKVSNIG
ncbi:hypothetical protein AK966_10430 [Vibrio sp. PID23_8]|jgi:hypothetical protein|nr:hypothetical protein AK965_04380 [Vibrio sp. PID17_43]RIZ54112.1 hypothetical protein AK966_10430 [Vibrio sp. PID23_8]